MPPAGLGQASVELVRLVRFIRFFFFLKVNTILRLRLPPVGLGASEHRFGYVS